MDKEQTGRMHFPVNAILISEISQYTHFSQGHSKMSAFQREIKSLRAFERQQHFQPEYPAASSYSIQTIEEKRDRRSNPAFIQPSSFLMQWELRHSGK